MSKNQKRTIIIGLVVIAITVVIWLASGGEIFTKTQVLIEKKDELFGTTYKEWQNKFVWGLDTYFNYFRSNTFSFRDSIFYF